MSVQEFVLFQCALGNFPDDAEIDAMSDDEFGIFENVAYWMDFPAPAFDCITA